MAGRELPLRFDWQEVPTIPMPGWEPSIGKVPKIGAPPFCPKAARPIFDFPIFVWQAGFTPTRNGAAPWIILPNGSALVPIFFPSRDAAVSWLQSPGSAVSFGARVYPLVWAESAERAEHYFSLRENPENSISTGSADEE